MGYKIEPKFSLGEQVILENIIYSSPPEREGLYAEVTGIIAFIGKDNSKFYKYLVRMEEDGTSRTFTESELFKL